jgi:hypothetical protein
MELRVDVYHHFPGDDRVTATLGRIDAKLDAIRGELEKMSPQLQAMTTEVTRATTVAASAVALIRNLAAQMIAAKDDPVAIQALADSLKTSDDAIAAAVSANTPAAANAGTVPPA